MGYLGLVPSEHSSGKTRRQGGITRTGNGHVRRVLVEAAWNYRFAARKTRCIEARAEKTSERVQAIAWEAQKRLCGRYRTLLQAGKEKKLVTTAVARELAGFISRARPWTRRTVARRWHERLSVVSAQGVGGR